MIGLMDCNNFFVSCERLFRPDLIRKPVAVLSSNDGCIVARSQEVKDLGIEMGAPYFTVKDICIAHGVTLFSSNFALYRDISARVMIALKEEFAMCEVYSIDESFFKVEGLVSENEFYSIRNRIMQKTGIPVSIGVAPTKTLAKLASGFAKKGTGVRIMDMSAVDAVASEVLCGSVWGVGRKTALFLSKNKIYTLKDFKGQDVSFIRSKLGVVGERLYMELKGVPVYPLGKSQDMPQGSYMSTRSFGRTLKDKSAIESAIAHHVAVLAEKLRHDNMMATQLTVIARGSRFDAFAHRPGSFTVMLPVPTHNTLVLTKEAIRIFQLLFDREVPYKKAGIILGCIVPAEVMQQTLFSETRLDRRDASIDSVIDVLNGKYGKGTVVSGLRMHTERWQEKKNKKSPNYTTHWGEIPKVRSF